MDIVQALSLTLAALAAAYTVAPRSRRAWRGATLAGLLILTLAL